VNRLYIEQGIDIERELYLSVLLDRSVSRNIVMASTEGGMEIERVAEETPEKILREVIDPAIGLANFQAALARPGARPRGPAAKNFVRFVGALADAAAELGHRPDRDQPPRRHRAGRGDGPGREDGVRRQRPVPPPEVVAMRDESEEDPAELEAKAAGLSYITLDGTIGCLVNGAGLAMATMDTIKHVGGEPANFLDVGGGADAEQVAKAFEIITADPNVKGIFVNIFGGIMRCDTIATGIVEAVKEVGLEVPLVVRLEGTNVEEGKEIIATRMWT
jgi:succinyl-CoA synthetase beta subunit